MRFPSAVFRSFGSSCSSYGEISTNGGSHSVWYHGTRASRFSGSFKSFDFNSPSTSSTSKSEMKIDIISPLLRRIGSTSQAVISRIIGGFDALNRTLQFDVSKIAVDRSLSTTFATPSHFHYDAT